MSFWTPQTFYCGTPYDPTTVVYPRITLSKEEMRNMLCISTENNTKETKKMKAKKCDRCGKLYEMPVNGENCVAEVRFRYLPVDDEENLSEKKIIEKQTKNIYISSLNVDVDICPDCSESFKRWFESGAGEN